MRVPRQRIARSDAVLAFAMLAVAVSVTLASLAPRGGSLNERARELDAQLRCPTCQGLSIADSPATSAMQMRALVREQLAAGASDDSVRAFFVARYGRWILLDPPGSGPDVALWLAPAAIVALGAALVVRRTRMRTPRRATRRWDALPPWPMARLPTMLVGAAMVLALAVPIAAAVGPRLAGGEVSGRAVAQRAPTVEELETFVDAAPDDVDALVALGDALVAAGRSGEAVDRYRAALEIDRENVRALLGVGAILLEADRPDAAGPVFDRVLGLSPDQPDALLYRALARLRVEGRVTGQVRDDVQRFLAVTSPDDARRAMATGLLEADVGPSTSPTAGAPVP